MHIASLSRFQKVRFILSIYFVILDNDRQIYVLSQSNSWLLAINIKHDHSDKCSQLIVIYLLLCQTYSGKTETQNG